MTVKAATADLTSDLAVVVNRELPEIVAWRNNSEQVYPSPRIAVRDAFWTGNTLKVVLENGQEFLGVFTELNEF